MWACVIDTESGLSDCVIDVLFEQSVIDIQRVKWAKCDGYTKGEYKVWQMHLVN